MPVRAPRRRKRSAAIVREAEHCGATSAFKVLHDRAPSLATPQAMS
jgi:hypothetical protein